MPSIQELISRGYGGYQGWGEVEAAADFAATGGAGKFTGAPGAPSPGGGGDGGVQQAIDIAKQMRQFNIESAQPAIQTLQSGIAPLKQQYQDLIAQIKGGQQQAEQQADITSAREMGRRGIPLSSTFAGQYQQQQKLPISTQYGNLLAQTGLGAQQSEQNILNAIAQLQGGAGPEAVSGALQITQQQQQQQYQQQALAQALQIAQMENQPKKTSLSFQTLGNMLYGLDPYTGAIVTQLQKQLGGGAAGYSSDWG